jgi:branched-chain amino acid transport system ATP-binding protein
MSEPFLLELRSVNSGYGKKTVIRSVEMGVGEGQIATLLGSNGVGKTTTLRTVTGQIRPTRGKVLFGGRDLLGFRPHQIAALGVGYSPEGRRIFGNLTVLENLVVGAYRLKTREAFKKSLEWVYSLFPILDQRQHQLSESLSGGEQQMLAIGRALISKPRLLLLDEPSLGLAPLVVEHIAETLLEINGAGVSILLVEQNADLALTVSHYAFVMDQGGIVFEGEPRRLKEDRSISDIYLGFD